MTDGPTQRNLRDEGGQVEETMETERGGGGETEAERDRHTAWTLMCLWGTNKQKVREMW